MKTSKYFLITTLFVMISSGAFAQTSDSDAASVAAEVLANITVTKDIDIDFAIIAQDITSNTPTIDPDNASNDANITGTATAGRFDIEGTAGQDIVFAASNFADVTMSNGSYTIDFNPALYGTAGTLSTDARGSGGSDLSSGGTATLTSGQFTVWVGGTLDTPTSDGSTATSALDPGSYSGTYTLTIDYN